MMKLGRYTFGVDTAAFQSFSRQSQYSWASQERIGREPALQYSGPGQDKVTLPGVMLPVYAGGLGQLDEMRTQAAQGQPLLMIDGRGGIHGYWVILSIRETQKHFLSGGVPRRVDFSLELQYHGERL